MLEAGEQENINIDKKDLRDNMINFFSTGNDSTYTNFIYNGLVYNIFLISLFIIQPHRCP